VTSSTLVSVWPRFLWKIAEATGIPFERVSNDDVPKAGTASRNG
jgi:hypothetical protein